MQTIQLDLTKIVSITYSGFFFLAEKPYSQQGPIITIKLSENQEIVTASDGTQQIQLVEMLFEMNYDSGHWRRLKRTRVVSKHGASSTPGQKTD